MVRALDLQNDLAKGLCLLVPGPGSSKAGLSLVAVVQSLDWCVHEHEATTSLASAWDHIALEQSELARARPDFEAPHRWRAAMAKEVRRVESFKAWTLVPFSDFRRDLRERGPDCTSIAYIVGAFAHKTDPNGDPRALSILNKFRVTCADVCQTEVDPLDTYSSCVDSITNRVITSVAPRLRAHQTTIDISSACYHGRPLPLVPKTKTAPATGLRLYTVVPTWLCLFGYYPYLGPKAWVQARAQRKNKSAG